MLAPQYYPRLTSSTIMPHCSPSYRNCEQYLSCENYRYQHLINHMLSTKNILYFLHINDNMDGFERFDQMSFSGVE